MGKSKATPRPSVREVTVMMTTAATSCQRAIWIRLEMYCNKGRLGDASRPRETAAWGADSLRGTGMVQTIAEAGCGGDYQHGHGCGLAGSVLTKKPGCPISRSFFARCGIPRIQTLNCPSGAKSLWF